MQRISTILIAVFIFIIGLTSGWIGRGTQVGDSRPAPRAVQHLQGELDAIINAVNQHTQEANPMPIRAPYAIRVSNTFHYYLDQGELGEGGLTDFTGRIVAWNGSEGMTEHNWPDRPGDGPDLSLYFDRGTLYCVEQHQGNLRYMFVQGKLRQVIGYSWTTQAGNASNTLRGDEGEHPYTAWRLDEQGRVTHYARIRDEESQLNQAWDANRQGWTNPNHYRLDMFFTDGQLEATITTGAEGNVRTLAYRIGDQWKQMIFDPQGQIVYTHESEAANN